MKSILFLVINLFAVTFSFSQNVGIGTTTPAAKLDVKSSSNYVGQFNGVAPMYMSIFENDIYRGYWGSYSGNAEDVDFGTGAGTTGKLHLTIQASPKLTIDNTGNVGIGTTTPSAILDVKSTSSFSGRFNGPDFMWMGIYENDIYRGYWGSYSGNPEDVDFGTGAGTTGKLHLTIQASPKLTIDNTGNVGIGTTTPGARLHINTSASETIRMQGSNPWMSFYDNTNGYQGYLWYNGNDIVLGSSTAAVKFASNGYRLSINTDGRVVIGSSNNPATGYLLSVDGKAICTELKVQLTASWPDYVFDENYHLLPIDQLEKSINENKHLPGLPSAADVTADKGFEVGDMNRRLLEKVEELTLYMIEANKKINSLQNQVNNLEKKGNN